ncbi:DUF342 domain-containing protein [Halalkalibacter urbisdiaboli]|uniref:DUF342 domain-containing protein n=1 Tax=Halalkalibacter urbisdiaboli TaxID=1960589 RepID=UPI000B4382A0|nr:FapA family protein [Halalkalibacter urbisdiaboli]
MIELDQFFSIQVATNKMEATLVQNEKWNEEDVLTKADLLHYIKEQGIINGIDEGALELFCSDENDIKEQQIIARGKPPVKGRDARLQSIQFEEKGTDTDTLDNINLKEFLEIPSVREGDKVGEKVKATNGTAGINIYGEEVPAKPGKDFKLRPGKNTRLDEEEQALYSLINGQISIEKKVIHVFPIYEVKGDLDLKTGNITFVGNVVIRGNVPTGYEVKADGDIRVTGTVEGAHLESGGSIFVGAGIVGQNKSLIKAKGDLLTTFINEGHVEAGGAIEVVQAILHSTCSAGTSIICTRGKGNIVGGSLSANECIRAKNIGNDMQTKTSIFVGLSEHIVTRERTLKQDLLKSQEELTKLSQLLKVYVAKEQQQGPLQGREKILKLRVQHSFQTTKEVIDLTEEQLAELKDIQTDSNKGFIKVEQAVFPNVDVNFGKYRRKLVMRHDKARISIIDSEINISTA